MNDKYMVFVEQINRSIDGYVWLVGVSGFTKEDITSLLQHPGWTGLSRVGLSRDSFHMRVASPYKYLLEIEKDVIIIIERWSDPQKLTEWRIVEDE